MGFLKNEKDVSAASGVEYATRSRADLDFFYHSPDSPLFCISCKKSLGVWHVLRFALFVKPGVVYTVPCRACGCQNERVKGELKKQFDDRWK